jgi:PAS domain S-box-containing protein
MKIKLKIFAVILGAVLLVAFSAGISIRAFNRIETAVEAERKTRQILDRTNNLMMDVVDSETGQRGYLLSGKEEYLEPYIRARGSIEGELKEIRRLALNPAIREKADELEILVAAKMSRMAEIIEHFRKYKTVDGLPPSADFFTGKIRMDEIRETISELIFLESDTLERQEDEFQSDMKNLLIIIVASFLLTLLFALAFSYFVYREKKQRLKNLVLVETRHLLEIGKETNKRLLLANATLQVSEEKLAVTLNSIGDAVMATDADGNITLLNPMAEKLTGWKKEEAAGKPVEEVFRIINEKTRRPSIIPIRETLKNGTTQGLANHIILLSRNGGECHIDDSCAPIRELDGRVVGAVLVFRDVTERWAGEEQIRILNEQQNTILDASPIMICYKDKENRFIRVNETFARENSKPKKEIEGKSCWDLFPKESADKYWQDDIEVISTGLSKLNIIEPMETSSGTKTIQSDKIPYRDSKGTIIGVIVFTRDVTAIRKIEKEMEKSNRELMVLTTELKRVARAKSEFLANMSHELRTPLNTINGFSEVLYDEIFGPLNEKQKKYVNSVLTSGKHLLLLINQILDTAKVESGKMKLTLTKLPMKGLLKEISNLVMDMAKKKRLHMSIEIAEDLPEIEADELKVKQIVYNLLSNVVKFTPEGGSIGMRAKRTGSDVDIEVWDTGIGIAPENMEKIFEGFFRANSPNSQLTEGTGLGLPLSKKLVELHGGNLSVKSPGMDKGTSVRFTLPIVPREAVA